MSDGRQPSEEYGIPLAQMNGVVGEVAVLNERRRVALADIDKATFS